MINIHNHRMNNRVFDILNILLGIVFFLVEGMFEGIHLVLYRHWKRTWNTQEHMDRFHSGQQIVDCNKKNLGMVNMDRRQQNIYGVSLNLKKNIKITFLTSKRVDTKWLKISQASLGP